MSSHAIILHSLLFWTLGDLRRGHTYINTPRLIKEAHWEHAATLYELTIMSLLLSTNPGLVNWCALDLLVLVNGWCKDALVYRELLATLHLLLLLRLFLLVYLLLPIMLKFRKQVRTFENIVGPLN